MPEGSSTVSDWTLDLSIDIHNQPAAMHTIRLVRTKQCSLTSYNIIM